MNSSVLNGPNTSNRRRFDVDITLLLRKENIDEFPRCFEEPFRCNFDKRKFDLLSTCFVRRNFDGWKIEVISMYSFDVTFKGENPTSFRCPFFIMDGKLTQLRRAFFDVFLKDKIWW